MAHHKAAKKSLRRDALRRKMNAALRSRMRTFIKKARLSIGKEHAVESLREMQSCLAKMAQKGIVHRNKAARLTSRIAIQVQTAARASESAG